MKIGFPSAAVVALCAALLACASGKGWDGRVYHAGRASFRTGPVPASWNRVDVDGAMLAFHDKETGGSMNVFARCGQDGEDVPLSALTKHLLIGFTERQYVEEKVVPMDGREALHTVVNAKLDGVPLSLSIYVLKKNGCVYDLVWVAPPDRFSAGIAGFEAFVAGFGTAG
ncbi:MAG: hypothetical protein ACXVEE_32260 [Polyangiales bacterium]